MNAKTEARLTLSMLALVVVSTLMVAFYDRTQPKPLRTSLYRVEPLPARAVSVGNFSEQSEAVAANWQDIFSEVLGAISFKDRTITIPHSKSLIPALFQLAEQGEIHFEAARSSCSRPLAERTASRLDSMCIYSA